MDPEDIRRINREALYAAKEAERDQYHKCDNKVMVYLVALGVAVVAYFLMKNYQPNFVMVVDSAGQLQFDQTRAVVASVVAGLLVLVVHRFM